MDRTRCLNLSRRRSIFNHQSFLRSLVIQFVQSLQQMYCHSCPDNVAISLVKFTTMFEEDLRHSWLEEYKQTIIFIENMFKQTA